MKKNDRRLSFRLTSSLLDEIETACREQNEPLSRFVKRALNAYLEYHFQEISPRLQKILKTSTVVDFHEDR